MADVIRRTCYACGLLSAVAIVAAAFGPWATISVQSYQHSVSGLNSPNHGWLVAAFGALGALAFADHLRRPRLWKAASGAVAGAAGLAVALHDRHDAQHAFSGIHIAIVQALQSFVEIGWGLDLALAGSILMGIAALALALADRLDAPRRPLPTSTS